MFNLQEYRRAPKSLADRITWFGLIAPGVILNKTGTLQKTFELTGHDLDTSTIGKLGNSCSKINHILKNLDSGWCLYWDVKRSKSVSYPNSAFPEPASRLLDAERRNLFESYGNFYESKYYLTLIYLPASDKALAGKNMLIDNSGAKIGINRNKDIQKFIDDCNSLIDSLSYPFVNIRALDDTETLTYLHSTVSTKNHTIKPPATPAYLDYLLTDMDLTPGLEPKLGNNYFKVLTLRFPPNESMPCMLDGLSSLDIEFRWTTRWISLDKQEAQSIISQKSRAWMSKRVSLKKFIASILGQSINSNDNSDVEAKNNDIDDAEKLLNSGDVGFGYYTSTIIVFDQNLHSCQKKISAIEAFVNDKGFTCIIESVNARLAFLGSIPGHTYANVRYPVINTLNLAHFINISSSWAGHLENTHFGDKFNEPAPLLMAQTAGNTPFRLVTHQGDVGHMQVLGPTGAGKSTLLVTLALQFLRYPNAQVIFFDKGNSAKVATLAVGGKHYQFQRGNKDFLSIQPLADIDNADEREWASGWLQGIIESQINKITAEQKLELWRTLENMASWDKEQRTILGLQTALQDKNMSLALETFAAGGKYGYLLDGEGGAIKPSHFTCFEMGHLFEKSKEIVDPVMDYLFWRLRKRFGKRPTFLVVDEGWAFLKNPSILQEIEFWLKETRKYEVSLCLASTSLADVQNSPLKATLTECCPTKIFLPNPELDKPEIRKTYASFGVSDSWMDVIAAARPKRHYFYTSPAGVRLFDLALGEFALSLVAHAGKEVALKCDEIVNRHGKDNFLKHWLSYQGLHWANDIIQQTEPKSFAQEIVSKIVNEAVA